MQWYAVNTKPRQENIAQLNLERLGVETFCPQLKQNKVIRRKRQMVVGPLFPGYLFVRCDVHTHYRAVSYAHGVQRMVAFGSVPVTVDEGMIESIKSRFKDGYVVIQPPSFLPGETVRIQDGPFEGLEAVFERETTPQQRVVLLLQSLSFQARVVVDRECIAKC